MEALAERGERKKRGTISLMEDVPHVQILLASSLCSLAQRSHSVSLSVSPNKFHKELCFTSPMRCAAFKMSVTCF